MVQFLVAAAALGVLTLAVGLIAAMLRGSADAILSAMAGVPRGVPVIAQPRRRVRLVTRPVRFHPALRVAA